MNKEKPQLECNGKCHLVDQLTFKKPSATSDTEKGVNSITEAFFPQYFEKVKIGLCTVTDFLDLQTKYWGSQSLNTRLFDYSIDPPPRLG